MLFRSHRRHTVKPEIGNGQVVQLWTVGIEMVGSVAVRSVVVGQDGLAGIVPVPLDGGEWFDVNSGLPRPNDISVPQQIGKEYPRYSAPPHLPFPSTLWRSRRLYRGFQQSISDIICHILYETAFLINRYYGEIAHCIRHWHTSQGRLQIGRAHV